MISIVISEKGGSERREHYEQDEVTIGRVKGNDVLLPKGNVSKRHARLIVRDGRYIVTDLKSTNGTYVNHRRITHATLVREGDRIYIGDFVLRIEDTNSKSTSAPASPVSFAGHPDSSTSQSAYSRIPGGGTPAVGTPPVDATHIPGPADGDVVSHFPIEHDPDESSPMLDVPGPPRVPSGLRSGGSGSTPVGSGPSTREARGSNPASFAISSEPHTPSLRRSSQPVSDDRGTALRRELLGRVIGAVEAELGSELDVVTAEEALAKRIRTAVDGAVSKAQEEVTGSGEIDTQPLRDAALAELLEIGPLSAVMEDDNITQVQVVLRDLVVHRRGRRVDHGHFGFGSEAGVARALMRMCAKAGVELRADQPFVEVELDDGRQLFAVRPGASPQGHILTIKRPQRRQATLDSMVRSGAISRGMATLLAHCIAARANILVAGGAESGAWELVAALAGAVPRHARAVWLRDRAGLDNVPDGSASIELGSDPDERLAAIGAASKVAAEHLVVPALAGHELTALLDAITQGTEGVVMCTVAGTLRQALDRLSADISANRAGVSVETAREWLGATFDLGLEVTRLRDGRLRVVRLAELRSGSQGTSVRDVFTFSYHRTAAGGSIEGSFYASGTVPRIVEDLAARGMPLDTSIFRRHPNA